MCPGKVVEDSVLFEDAVFENSGAHSLGVPRISITTSKGEPCGVHRPYNTCEATLLRLCQVGGQPHLLFGVAVRA